MIQINTTEVQQDIRYMRDGEAFPKFAVRKWNDTGETAFYIFNDAVGAYVVVWMDRKTYLEILQLLVYRDVDGQEITEADAEAINKRLING